mgnify:CR=1 FL=1
MQTLRKVVLGIIIVLVAVLLAAVLFKGKVYFNIFTRSLPTGIYLRKEGDARRGEYALTCLPREVAAYGLERGYLAPGPCPAGNVPVGKIIRGVPGDRYVIADGILLINNEKYPLERTDTRGRDLKLFYPGGEYVVNPGEYLLLSDYAVHSWDSRYWGPVSVEFLLQPWVVIHDKR